MKKIMLALAAVSIAAAADARILRVSNVSGSSAPYTSIEAAHDAASPGDTIMVDASGTLYFEGQITLTKSVVLLGPGYWLVENGIIEEGISTARLSAIHFKGEGSVIKGFTTKNLYIEAPKVIVSRCVVDGSIGFSKGADNCIVHQNFIKEGITSRGGSSVRTNYHSITNNIFTYTGTGASYLGGFSKCYIAYNTFRTSQVYISGTEDTTFEYNIAQSYKDTGSGNSFSNNYDTNIVNVQATNDFIDKDYYNIEIPSDVRITYGAFAGDSPYVFSGVPAGPVIQDLVVPTTVEMGSKLNVTIKVGVQQ
jgi:hypothetical protein